ncbi:MAG: PAS domain-containing hybrid sensor histidine kinase/response regulator, partial [Dissulfurimicrobium sp.]|uniref:PAS domain-containing hybrid sensor histidine kinase/response regulator n=1 Tax=Dissulfurimicrobium sp. TaxID=2022436 RepID=UPI00404A60B0
FLSKEPDMKDPQKYCAAFFQGPVVVLDRKNEEGWPIIFATANIKDVLGYTSEELEKGDVFYSQLIHSEDRERYEKKVAFCSVSGVQRFRHEVYRLVTKAGKVIYVFDYTTIIRDEAGKITNYIGYIIDVTDIVEKEAAIEEGKQRLELIMEAAGLGKWELDVPSGRYVSDSTWARMKGFLPEEVMPSLDFWKELLHPEDMERTLKTLNDHILGLTPLYDANYRIKTRDGRWIWIHSRGKAIKRDKDGRALKIIGVHEDVTSHYELLHKLEENEKKITNTYRFVRLMLDNVPDMIWAKDIKKRYIFANKATCDFLGAVDTDEPIGKDDMFFMERSRAQRPDRADWYTFGEICQNSDEIVMQNRRKQRFDEFGNVRGKFLFLDVHKAPFFDENGELIGTVGAGRDVTREKALEKERDEIQKKLLQAQKLEALGRIVGGIAHDLNNSLVPVLGYAEMGLKELGPDDRLYKHLSEIKIGAEKAVRIVKGLLAFSKKQAVTPTYLNINHLLRDLEPTLFKLMDNGITIQISAAPDLKPVLADKDLLDQVIMNLVINAKDAMPEGGTIRIETANVFKELQDDGRRDDKPLSYVMLAVIDTGCGMTEEVKEMIFEPFFTTKSIEKGVGLGLSMVYGVVKQHGGFIEVFSEPGKGSVFKLYFPVADNKITTLEPSKRLVLVVDDDWQICELISSLLKQNGYEVLSFTSPYELFETVKNKRPYADILITELIMPWINGADVFKRLKEIYPELKVIYLSDYSKDIVATQKDFEDLEQEAVFLQKPFSINDFLEALAQMKV